MKPVPFSKSSKLSFSYLREPGRFADEAPTFEVLSPLRVCTVCAHAHSTGQQGHKSLGIVSQRRANHLSCSNFGKFLTLNRLLIGHSAVAQDFTSFVHMG